MAQSIYDNPILSYYATTKMAPGSSINGSLQAIQPIEIEKSYNTKLDEQVQVRFAVPTLNKLKPIESTIEVGQMLQPSFKMPNSEETIPRSNVEVKVAETYYQMNDLLQPSKFAETYLKKQAEGDRTFLDSTLIKSLKENFDDGDSVNNKVLGKESGYLMVKDQSGKENILLDKDLKSQRFEADLTPGSLGDFKNYIQYKQAKGLDTQANINVYSKNVAQFNSLGERQDIKDDPYKSVVSLSLLGKYGDLGTFDNSDFAKKIIPSANGEFRVASKDGLGLLYDSFGREYKAFNEDSSGDVPAVLAQAAGNSLEGVTRIFDVLKTGATLGISEASTGVMQIKNAIENQSFAALLKQTGSNIRAQKEFNLALNRIATPFKILIDGSNENIPIQERVYGIEGLRTTSFSKGTDFDKLKFENAGITGKIDTNVVLSSNIAEFLALGGGGLIAGGLKTVVGGAKAIPSIAREALAIRTSIPQAFGAIKGLVANANNFDDSLKLLAGGAKSLFGQTVNGGKIVNGLINFSLQAVKASVSPEALALTKLPDIDRNLVDLKVPFAGTYTQSVKFVLSSLAGIAGGTGDITMKNNQSDNILSKSAWAFGASLSQSSYADIIDSAQAGTQPKIPYNGFMRRLPNGQVDFNDRGGSIIDGIYMTMSPIAISLVGANLIKGIENKAPNSVAGKGLQAGIALSLGGIYDAIGWQQTEQAKLNNDFDKVKFAMVYSHLDKMGDKMGESLIDPIWKDSLKQNLTKLVGNDNLNTVFRESLGKALQGGQEPTFDLMIGLSKQTDMKFIERFRNTLGTKAGSEAFGIQFAKSAIGEGIAEASQSTMEQIGDFKSTDPFSGMTPMINAGAQGLILGAAMGGVIKGFSDLAGVGIKLADISSTFSNGVEGVKNFQFNKKTVQNTLDKTVNQNIPDNKKMQASFGGVLNDKITSPINNFWKTWTKDQNEKPSLEQYNTVGEFTSSADTQVNVIATPIPSNKQGEFDISVAGFVPVNGIETSKVIINGKEKIARNITNSQETLSIIVEPNKSVIADKLAKGELEIGSPLTNNLLVETGEQFLNAELIGKGVNLIAKNDKIKFQEYQQPKIEEAVTSKVSKVAPVETTEPLTNANVETTQPSNIPKIVSIRSYTSDTTKGAYNIRFADGKTQTVEKEQIIPNTNPGIGGKVPTRQITKDEAKQIAIEQRASQEQSKSVTQTKKGNTTPIESTTSNIDNTGVVEQVPVEGDKSPEESVREDKIIQFVESYLGVRKPFEILDFSYRIALNKRVIENKLLNLATNRDTGYLEWKFIESQFLSIKLNTLKDVLLKKEYGQIPTAIKKIINFLTSNQNDYLISDFLNSVKDNKEDRALINEFALRLAGGVTSQQQPVILAEYNNIKSIQEFLKQNPIKEITQNVQSKKPTNNTISNPTTTSENGQETTNEPKASKPAVSEPTDSGTKLTEATVTGDSSKQEPVSKPVKEKSNPVDTLDQQSNEPNISGNTQTSESLIEQPKEPKQSVIPNPATNRQLNGQLEKVIQSIDEGYTLPTALPESTASIVKSIRQKHKSLNIKSTISNPFGTKFSNKLNQELYSIEKTIGYLLDGKQDSQVQAPDGGTDFSQNLLNTIDNITPYYTQSSSSPSSDAQYFTPKPIIEYMWSLAYTHGFKDTGTILEPSSGVGSFLKYAPVDKTVYDIENNKFVNDGVFTSDKVDYIELNPFSGFLTKFQFPDINWKQNRDIGSNNIVEVLSTLIREPEKYAKLQTILLKYLGFESVANKIIKDKKYDLIIGNPPYGKSGNYKYGTLEGQFYGDSLSKLNNDGLLIFVTPTRDKTEEDIKRALRNANDDIQDRDYVYKIVDNVIMPFEAFANNIDNSPNHRPAQIETSIVTIKKAKKDYVANNQKSLFDNFITIKNQYGSSTSSSISNVAITNQEASQKLTDKISSEISKETKEILRQNFEDRQTLRNEFATKQSELHLDREKYNQLILSSLYANDKEKREFNDSIIETVKITNTYNKDIKIADKIQELNKSIKNQENAQKQVKLPTNFKAGVLNLPQEAQKVSLEVLNQDLDPLMYEAIIKSEDSLEYGKINLQDNRLDLFAKGHLMYQNGYYVPSPYYFSGKVYDKIDQLDNDLANNAISKNQYNIQKKGLQDIVPYYVKIDTNNRQEKISFDYKRYQDLFNNTLVSLNQDDILLKNNGLDSPINPLSEVIDKYLDLISKDIGKDTRVFEKTANIYKIKDILATSEFDKEYFDQLVDNLKLKTSVLSKLKSWDFQEILIDKLPPSITWGQKLSKDNPNGVSESERIGVAIQLQNLGDFVLDLVIRKYTTPQQKTDMEDKVNREITNVPVRYDLLPILGGFTKYYGINKKGQDILFQFRRVQRMAITFLDQMKSGMLALGVGQGKTISAIAILEMQMSLGNINLPLIITPKPITPQFAKEIVKMLPGITLINLGGLSKVNIASLNKQGFIDASGMIDTSKFKKGTILIGTHELVENVIFDDESQIMLADVLDGIFPPENNKDVSKKMERFQKFLKDKTKGSAVLDFNKSGIDYLVTDEAHQLSNIFTTIEQKIEAENEAGEKTGKTFNQSVQGLDNKKAAVKDTLWFLMNQLLHKKGGGSLLLTATPMENKVQELYALLMAANPGKMIALGYGSLGKFIETFAETKADEESVNIEGRITTSGKLIVNQFKNKVELNYLLNEIMLYIGGDEAGIMRPLRNTIIPVLPVAGLQKAVQQYKRKSDDPLNVAIQNTLARYKAESMSKTSLAQSGFDMGWFQNSMVIPYASFNSIYQNNPSVLDELPVNLSNTIKEICDIMSVKDKKASKEILKAVYDNSPYIQVLVQNTINKFAEFEKGNYKAFTDDGIPGTFVINEQKSIARLIGQVVEEYVVDKNGKKLLKPGDIDYYDGYTDDKNKLGVQERFNNAVKDDDGKVIQERSKILIGSRSAITGLDLQKNADTVIFFSLPWNFTPTEQGIGRVNRFGSTYHQTNIIIPVLEGSAIPHRLDKLSQKEKRHKSLTNLSGQEDYYTLQDDLTELTEFDLVKYQTLELSDLVQSELRKYESIYKKELATNLQSITSTKYEKQTVNNLVKNTAEFKPTLDEIRKSIASAKSSIGDDISDNSLRNTSATLIGKLFNYVKSNAKFFVNIPSNIADIPEYRSSVDAVSSSVTDYLRQLENVNPKEYQTVLKKLSNLINTAPNLEMLRNTDIPSFNDVFNGELSQWFNSLSTALSSSQPTTQTLISIKQAFGLSGVANDFRLVNNIGNTNMFNLKNTLERPDLYLQGDSLEVYNERQTDRLAKLEASAIAKKEVVDYFNSPAESQLEMPDEIRKLITTVTDKVNSIKEKASVSYGTMSDIADNITAQIQGKEGSQLNADIYNLIDQVQQYSIAQYQTPITEMKEWLEKRKNKYYQNTDYKEINAKDGLNILLNEFNVYAKATTTSDLDYNTRTTVFDRFQEALEQPIIGDKIREILDRGKVSDLYDSNPVKKSSTELLGILTALTSIPALNVVAGNILPAMVLTKLIAPFFQSTTDIRRRNVDIPNQGTVEGTNIAFIEANIISQNILSKYKKQSSAIIEEGLKSDRKATTARALRFLKLNNSDKWLTGVGELAQFQGSDDKGKALPMEMFGKNWDKDLNGYFAIKDYTTALYNSDSVTSLQTALNGVVRENGYAKISTRSGTLFIGKLVDGNLGIIDFRIASNVKVEGLSREGTVEEQKQELEKALNIIKEKLEFEFNNAIKSKEVLNKLLSQINNISPISSLGFATPRNGDYKGTDLKSYIAENLKNNKYSAAQILAAQKVRETLNELGLDLESRTGIIGMNNSFVPISYPYHNRAQQLQEEDNSLNVFGGYNQATTKQKFDRTKGIVSLNIAFGLESMFVKNQKRLETSTLLNSLKLSKRIINQRDLVTEKQEYLNLKQGLVNLQEQFQNELTEPASMDSLGQTTQNKIDIVTRNMDYLNNLYGFGNEDSQPNKFNTFNSSFNVQGETFWINANLHDQLYQSDVIPTPVKNIYLITQKKDVFTLTADFALSQAKNLVEFTKNSNNNSLVAITDDITGLIRSGATTGLKNQNENPTQSGLGYALGQVTLMTQIVTTAMTRGDVSKIAQVYGGMMTNGIGKDYPRLLSIIESAHKFEETGAVEEYANNKRKTAPLGNRATRAVQGAIGSNFVKSILIPFAIVRAIDTGFTKNLTTTAMLSNLYDIAQAEGIEFSSLETMPIEKLARLIALAKNKTGVTLLVQGTEKNQSALIHRVTKIPYIGKGLYPYNSWLAQQFNNHQQHLVNIAEAMGINTVSVGDKMSYVQTKRIDLERLKDALIAAIYLMLADVAVGYVMQNLLGLAGKGLAKIGTATGIDPQGELNTRLVNPLSVWINNEIIGVTDPSRLAPSIVRLSEDYFKFAVGFTTGIDNDQTKQANQRIQQDIAKQIPFLSFLFQKDTFAQDPLATAGKIAGNLSNLKYVNDVFRLLNSATEKTAEKKGLQAFVDNAVGVDVVNYFNGGKSKDKTYNVTDPDTGKSMEVSKRTDLASKLFSITPGFDRNINASYLQDTVNRATDSRASALTKINDELSNLSGKTQPQVDKLQEDKAKILKQIKDNNLTIPSNISQNNDPLKGGNTDTTAAEALNKKKENIMNATVKKDEVVGQSKPNSDGGGSSSGGGGGGSGGSGGGRSSRGGGTRRGASGRSRRAGIGKIGRGVRSGSRVKAMGSSRIKIGKRTRVSRVKGIRM